jgi:hypothetical protein
MPSCFEIDLQTCRWVYKTNLGWIIITSWMRVEDSVAYLSLESEQPQEFAIVSHRECRRGPFRLVWYTALNVPLVCFHLVGFKTFNGIQTCSYQYEDARGDRWTICPPLTSG